MRLKYITIGLVACGLLSFWWLQDRVSIQPSGQVENQIRAFGPQLAAKLQPTATFERVRQPIAGYRPLSHTPQVPAGLKPVEQQAWEAMAKKIGARESPNNLTPLFPANYAEGTEVRGQGMAILLKPLASNSAAAQIENGKLVYHNAYTETDSLLTVAPGRSEEFLLLRNATAPERFEYEITSASGVKDVTLQGNAIHFKNAKGEELQLEAPWLMESSSSVTRTDSAKSHAQNGGLGAHGPPLKGNRVAANRVHWELTPAAQGASHPRLALVIDDPKSLHYPVLIDPSWSSPLGSLNTARISHTATLLNNGQVLVVGGYTSENTGLDSAELYDPAIGVWTTTGSLHTTRFSHTATLLANGKVLVVGGVGENNAFLVSAELYDPIAGTWTLTGSLHAGRYRHTATPLPNGDVLVLAGLGDGGALATAELYDSATGVWKVAGSLQNGRFDHTATLLGSGLVLVAGGADDAEITSAELYNPESETSISTGSLNVARFYHTATLLPGGQVLVAGGRTDDEYLSSAELYDPVAGTWANTGGLNVARALHTASLLPNGEVLVTGGENSTDVASTELFNPATKTWSIGASLLHARYSHTATLLANGEILVAGGSGPDGALTSTELYDSTQPVFSTIASMTTARDGQTATLLPNGNVLVVGGEDFHPPGVDYLSSAELYHPGTETWTITGSMATPRFGQTATLLPNGQVLVAGGSKPANGPSAELYNPATGIWTITGSLHTTRSGHTATLLPNGQVLVAGGGAGTAGMKSAELYDPASGTWTITGSMVIARIDPHIAVLLMNGKVLVAGGSSSSTDSELYDPVRGTWSVTGPLRSYYQLFATLLPNGQVLEAGASNDGTAELYNPATGYWSSTGNFSNRQQGPTAMTLLPNGLVLALGTGDYPYAALYNPATGSWTTNGQTITRRGNETMTLLPNGKDLIAGGDIYTSAGDIASVNRVELFDLGLGDNPSTQPQLDSVPTLSGSSGVTLTGSGFTGLLADGAASDIPVIQLQSLVNDQVLTLSIDPTQGFDTNTFVSLAPAGFVPGYTRVTVFVNGTPSVSQIALVAPLQSQTINFPPIGDQTYGNPGVTLSATASSGLPVVYGVISGLATISGDKVTFTGPGPVVLQAGQAGNGTYASAYVQQSLTVAKTPQTITFPTITGTQYVESSINLSATASSGLPVTFRLISGPATLNGSSLLLTGPGAVTVEADQAGSADYLAAPSVRQSLVSNSKMSQTISFGTIADQPVGTSPFTLSATASSGLTVTYGVTGPATVAGDNPSRVVLRELRD